MSEINDFNDEDIDIDIDKLTEKLLKNYIDLYLLFF
jgi:hypothetical protein